MKMVIGLILMQISHQIIQVNIKNMVNGHSQFTHSSYIKGSPKTPYIWDDVCTVEDAAERIMELYKMDPKERKVEVWKVINGL
jgi:hypothetical protein